MLARFAVRSAAPAKFAVRKFSGHSSPAEAKKETETWFKATIGMIGVSAVFAVYNVVFHSHDHPRTDLPYMHIRNKPYPWSCPDCNLFDNQCWKECRGGAPAESSHH